MFQLQSMKRNLRGEMTVVAKENITILDFELIESVARALSVSSTEVHVHMTNQKINIAIVTIMTVNKILIYF